MILAYHVYILFLSFYDYCCVKCHENCTPDFLILYTIIFFLCRTLNISIKCIVYFSFSTLQGMWGWGWGDVFQIIICYIIRKSLFFFQIFMFLCLHDLYMAYAWSQWSQLKPSKNTLRFKGFLFDENFHGRKFSYQK